MNKEKFASIQLSMLLKEKGFDETCRFAYYKFNENYIVSVAEKRNSQLPSNCFSITTYSHVLKWLRENHNVFVLVVPHYSRKYETIKYEYKIATYSDIQEKPIKLKKSKEYYEKYDGCLNDGILEALKLI